MSRRRQGKSKRADVRKTPTLLGVVATHGHTPRDPLSIGGVLTARQAVRESDPCAKARPMVELTARLTRDQVEAVLRARCKVLGADVERVHVQRVDEADRWLWPDAVVFVRLRFARHGFRVWRASWRDEHCQRLADGLSTFGMRVQVVDV